MKGWRGKGIGGRTVWEGEELVNGSFVLLEVIFHIRGGEGVYEGIKEVSHGGGRESINEITKAVVIEEVKDDEAGSVGCGIG